MKTIKVLGTGCPNCIRLENNVKIALEKAGIEAKVEKVTDIAEIMSYNIMSTPGLVIDEKLVSYGKVAGVDEIVEFLKDSSCCNGEQNTDEGCCSDKDVCSIDCVPKKEEVEKPKSPCACGGMC